MYVAGIMDHFSDAPRMELLVWGSTVGILTSLIFRSHSKVKGARSKAGSIKPGSTGPPFWTNLAVLGQLSAVNVPPLIYWTTTAYNGFKQPEWMTEHALPSLPDVFGADGVVVGRTAGLLAFFAGGALVHSALKVLGDQFHVIGIKENPRLVDNGPFAHVRHPIYTGYLIVGTSLSLALWSYIPLYVLPVAVGACLLKVSIEERTIERDPELGNEYKIYKFRVPYRIIPYIW